MSNDLQTIDASVVALQARAEYDMAVETAKRHPREVSRCVNNALALATRNEDIAAACVYAVPRDGKTIEGPSVRLAEIIATNWQNLRAESRVVGEDETGKSIICQAMAADIENNVAIRVEVRRRIVKKDGSRYSEDMLNTTANAGCSIALRNAVFRVIPRPFVDEIMDACKAVVRKNVPTTEERMKKAVSAWNKYGITERQVLKHLDRAALMDITPEDYQYLRNLWTAMETSEADAKEIFSVVRGDDPESTMENVQSMRDLKNKAKGKDASKTQPAGPTPQDVEAAIKVKHIGADEFDGIVAKLGLEGRMSETFTPDECQSIIDEIEKGA